MMMTLRPILLLSLASLLALSLACTGQAPAASTGEPTMPLGQGSAATGSTSPAIAVSADLVTQFAEAQAAINADWDAFHNDLDGWRSGLTACDRAAATSALRNFAGDFGDITKQARALPGKGIARELPSEVIMAATGEETALRNLRDNWNPVDPSLLEMVQTERAVAADLLRSTQIEMDKLADMDDPEDRIIAKEFARALAAVDDSWDSFNVNYQELQDEYLELSAEEIVTRLRDLTEQHDQVLLTLEDMPSDKVTDPVLDPLVEAAETEASALGDLLDAMRKAAREDGLKSEEPSQPAVDITKSEGNGSPEETGADDSSADGDGPSFPTSIFLPPLLPDPDKEDGGSPFNGGDSSPDYSEHFDAFEATRDETRSIRKQASRDLDGLVEGFSESDREALAEFSSSYADLMGNWEAFHNQFDEWVRTEGGCNRANALAALQLYDQRFNEISSRVRGLSQASYLRPSSDLLAEAAEREGAALRNLANTWAPYESDVYRRLTEERQNGEKLRRLADRRIQELLERNGITP